MLKSIPNHHFDRTKHDPNTRHYRRSAIIQERNFYLSFFIRSSIADKSFQATSKNAKNVASYFFFCLFTDHAATSQNERQVIFAISQVSFSLRWENIIKIWAWEKVARVKKGQKRWRCKNVRFCKKNVSKLKVASPKKATDSIYDIHHTKPCTDNEVLSGAGRQKKRLLMTKLARCLFSGPYWLLIYYQADIIAVKVVHSPQTVTRNLLSKARDFSIHRN